MAQPTVFSVNSNNFTENGYVRVSWANQVSANHYSYRVYRLDPDASGWVLVKERVDTPSSFTFDDYFAPVGSVYYAVVEVTESASVQTEETKVPKLVTLSTPYYWLLHPTDSTKNILLRGVNAEEFKNEREQSVKKLIGRGRKIDVGDDWGKTGSISGRIYDRTGKTARQARLDIEAAKDEGTHHFMRNPFGDVWKIWFDDPQFGRIAGVGTSEYVDISFTYYEVA